MICLSSLQYIFSFDYGFFGSFEFDVIKVVGKTYIVWRAINKEYFLLFSFEFEKTSYFALAPRYSHPFSDELIRIEGKQHYLWLYLRKICDDNLLFKTVVLDETVEVFVLNELVWIDDEINNAISCEEMTLRTAYVDP